MWKQKIEQSTFSKVPSFETESSLLQKWNSDDSRKNFLTIGFPNVGKSSFLNAVMGHKVVSVSKTPGHTKYYQTIFVTNDVVFCDCPGLVFPSLVEKQWQILSGIFPVSQVREPYTSVGYLAEGIDLVNLLKLEPVSDTFETSWSAWEICASWAVQRGFLTAKSNSRPDVYRAANHILRLSVDGKIGIYQLPLGFNDNFESFEKDSKTNSIREFLKRFSHLSKLGPDFEDQKSESSSTSNDEDEDDENDTKNMATFNKFSALKID